MELSDFDLQTLREIELRSPNLNHGSVQHLFNIGLLWSEYSSYGYKLSDEGKELLDSLDAQSVNG